MAALYRSAARPTHFGRMRGRIMLPPVTEPGSSVSWGTYQRQEKKKKKNGSAAVFNRRCSLTGMIDIRLHQSTRQ
jgi:hypothetical protein